MLSLCNNKINMNYLQSVICEAALFDSGVVGLEKLSFESRSSSGEISRCAVAISNQCSRLFLTPSTKGSKWCASRAKAYEKQKN